MRKFAKNTVYFLLYFITLSVLINLIFLVVIAKTDWGFSKRIESIRWEDPDYELLSLGTSLADYGIDAQLLTEEGIKSYNLALVGSSIKTCYIQLNEYLTKYDQCPRYVLLSVNGFLERFDQEGIQPIVEFTMKGQKIDFMDVPISKFQWQTTELIKKAFSEEYRSGYTSYGQTRRRKVTPDFSDYKNNVINVEEFESAYWIGEIAKLCNNNQIELFVIEIPTTKENQNLSEVGPYKLAFDNGHAANLYNLNSREFCQYIDSKNDWSGLSHFNEVGAANFTRELLKIIRE